MDASNGALWGDNDVFNDNALGNGGGASDDDDAAVVIVNGDGDDSDDGGASVSLVGVGDDKKLLVAVTAGIKYDRRRGAV